MREPSLCRVMAQRDTPILHLVVVTDVILISGLWVLRSEYQVSSSGPRNASSGVLKQLYTAASAGVNSE